MNLLRTGVEKPRGGAEAGGAPRRIGRVSAGSEV